MPDPNHVHIIIPPIPIKIHEGLEAAINAIAIGVSDNLILQIQNRAKTTDSTLRFILTKENTDWLLKALKTAIEMRDAKNNKAN